MDFIITPVQFLQTKLPVVLISIIPELDDIEHINAMIQRIEKKKSQQLIRRIFRDLFDNRLFFVNKDFMDREEVLRHMCHQMEVLNITNPGFYEDVLDRENISTTGFNNAFALPHALHPQANVSKIAVTILKKPMKWGYCRVQLVMLFAIDPYDESNMMPVYEKIIRNLNHDEHIALLLKTDGYEAFINGILTMME